MTPPFNAGQALPELLPALRDDMALHASGTHADGSPAWTIQDPVSNRFYRIGWLEFELLARWHLGTPQAVLAATTTETLLQPSADELYALLLFLQANHLLVIHDPRYTDTLRARYRASRLSRLQSLLHHYLFFRIPLWHPQQWLHKTLPLVTWVYRPLTLYALLATLLLAMFLVARQVDVYTAAFAESLSMQGFAGYLLALALSKSLHELGHAYTATRYGVRVAHMGLAFLVLWPVLYTDTGESWKLPDRRQRLAISSAGIVTELGIATLATLGWALCEPGDVRQALFFLATTSWALSLALNASPFMRFDGYFILSDLLDFQNLHERSSALARHWLRHTLLGWNDPDPEHFAPVKRRLLIAFAVVTWVYRLTVFLGIAAAVYFMFFKLLGIVLFLVEMAWFVLRPFVQEFRVWYARADDISTRRKWGAAVALSALLLALGTPWSLSVQAPAYAHSERVHVLFSPTPALLTRLPMVGGPVRKNALLMEFSQPESALRGQVAQVGTVALDSQLAGLGAMPLGEEKRSTLEQQRAVKQQQLMAESQEQARLQLRAPFDGVLTDLDPELAAGAWVSSHQPLGVVLDPQHWSAEAFVGQAERLRIHTGSRVRFYPQDTPLQTVEGEVTSIDTGKTIALPHTLLSSRFGGPLPVLADANGLTPRDALYRVRIQLATAPRALAVQRGSIHIEAQAHSWLLDALYGGLSVLVREASF